MSIDELIESLDTQFCNEYAPSQFRIIKEAVKQLRFLKEDNEAMRQQIAELVASKLEN